MNLPLESWTHWHLLDARGIITREFASELGHIVPTVCWDPDFAWFSLLHGQEPAQRLADPPLNLLRISIQRGFSRPLIGWLSRFAPRTTALLQRLDADPAASPLICTSPFYAPVAERWPGPVIYYLTDLAAAYDNLNARQVMALDRRLCGRAALVCPNSRRLSDYLVERCECDPAKITLVPNATRRASIRNSSDSSTGEPPADIRDLRRPLLGVIGNLAANMDWDFIERSISLTPSTTWVFVGTAAMKIPDAGQSAARDRVLANRNRVRLAGFKPYGMLREYARCFDVAVLPYHRHEPTFSGSATRFYEHLAACRPMLSTRGVEELTHKEPLLRLVDTAEQFAAAFAVLEQNGFRDGQEEARRAASHSATWDCRAQTVVRALEARLSPFVRAPLGNQSRDHEGALSVPR